MKILVFGITGTIGQQLLEVLEEHELVGVSFYKNTKLGMEIVNKYQIKNYYCFNNDNYSSVKNIDELIIRSKPDLIINAIVGYKGLEITIKSIEHKIDLGLANKESLVIAGKFIKELLIKNKVNIFPIDSEHSSLYEILKNKNKDDIKKIYITCSGGSCYLKTKEELASISFEEVIKHPNWNMGYKISIDSATLINKCFEIVEAYWLFDTKDIIPIYHPESLVHSFIMMKDNSYQMYVSYPSMKLPIKLAINKYQISNAEIPEINFNKMQINFDFIDTKKHIPIQWAYDIINDQNNTLGLIINVANEIAIELFKNKKIEFIMIIPFISSFIEIYKNEKIKKVDDIFYLLDKIISSDYEQVIQNIKNN